MAQHGRNGMGSHKHGTSGHAGPSPRTKLMRMLEANKTAEADQKKPRAKTYGSVKEAMEAHTK